MKVYSVYKKYNKDFLAYAKSITGNKDIAFDFVQNAYVKALENEIIVKGLLETLPEKNMKVLILKYYLHLNSDEIGKTLGILPSTVRSRLSASLKLLKKIL